MLTEARRKIYSEPASLFYMTENNKTSRDSSRIGLCADCRYAQQIASMPGGLRTLAQVLRQSRAFARGMKRPVDQNIMRAAAGSLGIDE